MNKHRSRRRNLRILIDRAGGVAEFADAIGINRAVVHGLCKPKTKANISDELARRIELVCRKPHEWMDCMHPDEQSTLADTLEQVEKLNARKFRETQRVIWKAMLDRKR